MKFLVLVSCCFAQNQIQIQNGQDALRLDSQKFNNVQGNSCAINGDLCVGDKVGQCVNGKIIVTADCGASLKCQVLPLVNKRGTTVTCDSDADKLARFEQAGVKNGAAVNVNSPAVTILSPIGSQPSVQSPSQPTIPPVPQGTNTRKANEFECIDDTKFKMFTSSTDFVVLSCAAGQCATRNPPNKNPCVGKENAQRIDNPK